jgi:PAS domain S-box-containing protein
LSVEEAKTALGAVLSNLDEYFKKGQIEVLDYKDWYTKTGEFNADVVLKGWINKEEQALAKGFDGLRLTGNTFWIPKKDWANFAKYEENVNNIIRNYKMIAICSYSLERCNPSEIIEVVCNHQSALILKDGRWSVILNSKQKKTEDMKEPLKPKALINMLEDLEESKEKIKKERNFSKTIIDIAQAIILVLDPEGRIVSVNPYMEELSGYKLEEVKGKDWFTTFLPECDHYKIRNLFKTALDDVQTKGNVNPIVTKDGRQIDIKWHDKTLKDEDGKVIGLLVVGEDITKHKKAEEPKA